MQICWLAVCRLLFWHAQSLFHLFSFVSTKQGMSEMSRTRLNCHSTSHSTLSHSALSHVTLHQFPVHLVQYQLLPFLNTKIAVKLTQASQHLFHTLRHKLHRDEFTNINSFYQQSQKESKHIGVCSAVKVCNADELLKCVDVHQAAAGRLYSLLKLQIMCNVSLVGTTLPTSLHTLIFGPQFNQSLTAVALPTGLLTLEFGCNYNQSLADIELPRNLQTLTLGCKCTLSPEHIRLPESLQTLNLFSVEKTCVCVYNDGVRVRATVVSPVRNVH